MKYFLEYCGFRIVVVLINRVPLTWLPIIGKTMGNLLYRVGLRKAVVLKNLSIAFSDYTDEQLHALAKEIYRNACIISAEMIRLHSLAPEALQNHCHIAKDNAALQKYQEQGQAILTAMHIGNWEILAAALMQAFSRKGYVFAVKQKNHYMNRFMKKLRQRFGVHTIYKSKGSIRDLIKQYKNKASIAFLCDLNVRKQHVFVDLFGLPASYTVVLAKLARKLKAPLIFITNKRVGLMQYETVFTTIEYTITDNEEDDIYRITAEYNKLVEHEMRTNPEQYFWFNKRWKKRPPGDLQNIYA